MNDRLPARSPAARLVQRASQLTRQALSFAAIRPAGLRLRTESVWLTNASGYRIFVETLEPYGDEPRPAVVLVPGQGDDRRCFYKATGPLSARALAAAGVRTVLFDPIGRGRSWGHDDFGGIEGQDALRAVLDFAQSRRSVQDGRLGVVAFGQGVSLAAPVLAKNADRLNLGFFVDVEGLAGSALRAEAHNLPPAALAAMQAEGDTFWTHRDPLPSLGAIPCPYLRLQRRPTEADAPTLHTALDSLAEACRGQARWTRLNDNPPDVAWRLDQSSDLHWCPRGPARWTEAVLQSILSLVQAGASASASEGEVPNEAGL